MKRGNHRLAVVPAVIAGARAGAEATALRAFAVGAILVAGSLAGAVLAPGAALGADAHAEADAHANQLVKDGVILRRRGDDVGALKHFQEAYEIDKSPRVVAQMGLAEHALGRWGLAYEHLSQALHAGDDPWIVKNRTTIAEALNLVNEHLGKLEILGGTPGAEVRVDGVMRGTMPLGAPLILSTGAVTIELSASGSVSVQRTTVVRPRLTMRESFDPLAPAAARAPVRVTEDSEKRRSAPLPAPAGATEVPGPGPTPAALPPSLAPASADITSAPGGKPSAFRASAKWIAWGLGGVAAGIGAFGLARQNGAADQFDRGCSLTPQGAVQPSPGAGTTVASCRDLNSRVDSSFRLEVIGFASAGALVVAGVVLWVTEPRSLDREAVAWTCEPGVAATGLSLGCHVRF